MPKPSLWMIWLSLLYLLVSATAGGVILVHKAVDIHPVIWSFLPIHYELAIWGWLVQFVMGTAYWMFPKYVNGKRRGSVAMAWGMVFVFNMGLSILVLSMLYRMEPLYIIAGRCLLVISVITFSLLMWRRVVSYRELTER